MARALLGVVLGTAPVLAQEPPPFTLLVMDPLSSQLACACVQGYAQRDYLALGAFLQQQLGHPVRVVHAESLPAALAGKANGRVDLVVGKHSVVLYDARRANLAVTPLLSLSGPDGGTTQTGLLVVRSGDPAQKVSDLRGYRVLFGPEEAEEKCAAAMAMLTAAGVPLPTPRESFGSCSDAARALLALPKDTHAAAMLSSYARPLLEGCGTIDAGSLRVISSTAPVAFLAAFATDRVPPEDLASLRAALSAVHHDAALCQKLESRDGFVAYRAPVPAPTPWPSWRGAARDGQVPWLPGRLPAERHVQWEHGMMRQGLGGIAANERFVIVSDRNDDDSEDVWQCLAADTGKLLWAVHYSAPGKLDYGNSPRAAPLLHQDRAYLLGAHGQLHCVVLDSGKVLWHTDLIETFAAVPPTWGYCSSPLLANGVLIVNPGAPEASLVGLDPDTGKMRWQTKGDKAAYASFVVGNLGGRRQLIGYDATSLSGFDPANGQRLWQFTPKVAGDFHVPTPIVVDGTLLLCTENNGTRQYRFRKDGTLDPEPFATFPDLAPDTTTPVATAGRLFGNWQEMYALDLANGLRPVWAAKDAAYGNHACLFASTDRVLFVSGKGELLLLDATAPQHRVLSRQWAFDAPIEVYSHPALVGDRFYIRGSESIRCLRLTDG